VVAAWRIKRPELDAQLARGLGFGLLVALPSQRPPASSTAGRPSRAARVAVLARDPARGARCVQCIVAGRGGYLWLLGIAFVSLWAGLTMLPTILHGYVLLAVPAFLARTVTVVLLGGALSLILMAVRVLEESTARRRARRAKTVAA